MGPAYAAYMENRLRRAAPEYLADLIVLEKDPFTCVPEDLLAMGPLLQWWEENGSGRPKEAYGRPESTYT